MSAHTPGPWECTTHSWHETGVYSTVQNQRICKLDTEDWGVDESTEDEFGQIQGANARLIAAAPDLLAALQNLLEMVDVACGTSIPSTAFKGGRLAAHAALLKATGSAA